MVKIGSVTAEIFRTWTNVVMTNVALTNVPVTVKICTRWSKGPNFKVLSKLGQLTAEKLPTLSFCGGGVG